MPPQLDLEGLIAALQGRTVNWWRVTTVALAGVVVILFLDLKQQQAEVQEAQLAYNHPATQVQTRWVKVQGATRVVTRTVEVPGRTEIVTEQVQGPVVYVHDGLKFEEPLLPNSLSAKPSKRWFVGLGVLNLAGASKAGLVDGGVTLFDRVDLGVGVDTDLQLLGLASYRF